MISKLFGYMRSQLAQLIYRGSILVLFRLENESEFQWELKRTFSGHTDAITRICASATQSGERFASASIDGSVNLWTISGEAHYQTPVFSVQLKHEIVRIFVDKRLLFFINIFRLRQ